MPQDFPGKGAAAGWYNVPGKGTRYYDGSNEFSYGDQHGRIPLGNLLGAANVWGGQFGLGTTRRAGDVVSSLGEGSSTPSKPVPKLPTSPTSPTPGNPPGPPVPQIKSRADVTPIASNVEEAYSQFKNDYSGNGFNTGQLNPQGFYNWSDKDNWGIASNQINPQVDIDWSNKDTWNTASNWSDGSPLGAEYGKFSDNFSDFGKFINSDENQAAAFTTHAPQIVKPAASGGLAGLRVDEKEAGVVYASGAYWMDGADGKLEKIMDPDTAGWTANRAQALEIARNRLKTGGDTGESVSETASEPAKIDLNTPMTGEEPDLVPNMTAGKNTPSGKKDNPNVSYNPLNKPITDSRKFGGAQLAGGNYSG